MITKMSKLRIICFFFLRFDRVQYKIIHIQNTVTHISQLLYAYVNSELSISVSMLCVILPIKVLDKVVQIIVYFYQKMNLNFSSK